MRDIRILVIKLSSMGDIFHPLPAVHIIKRELNAVVDWVTTDIYTGLVECFTDIDRVIPFPRKSFFSDFSDFRKQLRKYKYDYILDFQGLMKSAIVAVMADGKKRIGPSYNRENSKLFYSEIAGEKNLQRHAVEQCFDFVRFFGLEVTEPVFPVKYPEFGAMPDVQHPAIALLPASRWETKNWSEENFVELGKLLQKGIAKSLFLLGGAAEKDLCERIKDKVGGNITNLAGKMSIVETGAFLQKMDLLIGNDSGPVHMAAASGIRCLVIFGPTDARRTGPYGDIHRVITADVDCRPCFSRTCKSGNKSCMANITPAEVYDYAVKMIE